MPNVGGPSYAKRRTLLNVVMSRLQYAAPVWAEKAMRSERNRVYLIRAHRLVALRMARAYRTVSDDAALFLAGTMPVDLAALERARDYQARTSGLPMKEVRDSIAETRHLWQDRWTNRTRKAIWTRRVLPDVGTCVGAGGYQRISFHLTKAFTGHGCFCSYLFKRGRAESPFCLRCPSEPDDVEHTLFRCEGFAPKRMWLTAVPNRPPTPEDIEPLLCGTIDDRKTEEFVGIVCAILAEKETGERTRQREDGSRAVSARRGKAPRRRR